ncbi:hypothetical protein [Marivita sp. XM-24bin2]|uniref:COG4223 family protein n=1 Tax=unclassified Marivita TaxID=2632480 RepID=UPI000D7B8681|nr:hypothetical protein [Marivita sp. XM-24bin2]MCR9110147.1 hypothetical protein [Paracoccaceae bacterium]PWL30353.1 MAG: hypothetical protein DCO97_21640 [Marivita sp. XM-24bin2]
MAKRKSTRKTTKEKSDQAVETEGAAEQKDVTETTSNDADTVTEAVEAVEVYAPKEEGSEDVAQSETEGDASANKVSDEAIEQPETIDPTDDITPDPDSATTSESLDTDEGEGPKRAEEKDDHLTEDEAEALIEEAEAGEHHEAQDADITSGAEATEKDEEPASEPETLPVAPQVVKETTIERKGGFVPMLLGGVAAAVLGYGVAAYSSQAVWPFAGAEDAGFEDEIRQALTTQDGSLSDLGARIANLESQEAPTVDLSSIEERLATLEATDDELTSRLDALVGRIDTLERQPMESAVSEEAIAAYERALADLQAEIEAQRAEVEQMAQEAVAAEASAEEKAQLAASRAAMAELSNAIDNGSVYSDALTALASNGVDVPEVLAAQADTGVPTQSELIASFPDAAREALSEARKADTEGAEGVGRVATFFANQLGARSVAPREGDDPDAILSRAEAAVRSGDLEAALSEISALPEVAQAALSDWQARAQTRLGAKSAADALVQQLLQE